MKKLAGTKEVYIIMKNKALVFALAGMMAVTSLTGCSSSFDGDAVAITVGEEEVTAAVANFYARYTQAQYETYYGAYLGENMWSSEASEGKNYEEFVKESVQDSLEVMVLSEQHADEYKAALTDEEKEMIVKSAKEFEDANDQKNKDLVSGDQETVERVMTLLAVNNKVMEAIKADADTDVSDEEAAQKSMMYVRYEYESYNEDGETETVTDEEKAELQKKAKELSDAAKNGGDFEKLAKDQEMTPNTVSFDSESTNYDAELIAAADQLKKDEVSDVIETETACYVVKLVSEFDKEATETKKSEIVSERQNDLYTEVTDGWKEEVEIKVDEKVWDAIDFNQLSVSVVTEETDSSEEQAVTEEAE